MGRRGYPEYNVFASGWCRYSAFKLATRYVVAIFFWLRYCTWAVSEFQKFVLTMILYPEVQRKAQAEID